MSIILFYLPSSAPVMEGRVLSKETLICFSPPFRYHTTLTHTANITEDPRTEFRRRAGAGTRRGGKRGRGVQTCDSAASQRLQAGGHMCLQCSISSCKETLRKEKNKSRQQVADGERVKGTTLHENTSLALTLLSLAALEKTRPGKNGALRDALSAQQPIYSSPPGISEFATDSGVIQVMRPLLLPAERQP